MQTNPATFDHQALRARLLALGADPLTIADVFIAVEEFNREAR